MYNQWAVNVGKHTFTIPAKQSDGGLQFSSWHTSGQGIERTNWRFKKIKIEMIKMDFISKRGLYENSDNKNKFQKLVNNFRTFSTISKKTVLFSLVYEISFQDESQCSSLRWMDLKIKWMDTTANFTGCVVCSSWKLFFLN